MANGTDAALTAEQLATGGNRLLAASPTTDLAFLAGCSRRVHFSRDELLWRAHAAGQPSLFVERGVASTLKAGAGERAPRSVWSDARP